MYTMISRTCCAPAWPYARAGACVFAAAIPPSRLASLFSSETQFHASTHRSSFIVPRLVVHPYDAAKMPAKFVAKPRRNASSEQFVRAELRTNSDRFCPRVIVSTLENTMSQGNRPEQIPRLSFHLPRFLMRTKTSSRDQTNRSPPACGRQPTPARRELPTAGQKIYMKTP
jgi:hypothetical protein